MNTMHSFFTQIRQLIAQDELKEAVHLLQQLLQNSPKLDEAILQSARLNEVSRQIRLGLIDHKQADLTENQIRAGILELLSEIEEQHIASPEVQEEVEQFMTTSIFGENIVTGNVSAGGDVIIGDTTVAESGTSRRLKVFLYFFVPLLAIAAAFLWYRLIKMKEPLTLTVAIENRTLNPELPFEGGTVTLQYGDKSETLSIRHETDFKGIPANFRDETVALRFEAPGFVKSDTVFVLSSKRLTLPIRRDNSLAHIFGTVKNQQGNSVADAQINVQDITVRSDESGNFSLLIPFEKQRIQQRMRVLKKGYREWDYTIPVIANEAVGIILKSKK